MIFRSNEEPVNYYKSNCKFWISNEGKLVALCYLDENIPKGVYHFYLNESITYNNYNITILNNFPHSFVKLDMNVPQLYSSEQTINVEDGKESYEIKFKISAYNNNDKIYLIKGQFCIIPLKNCKSENGELKCIISKSILDQITKKNGDYFYIGYYTYQNSILTFELVHQIYINYLNINKKKIYVGITKLIDNITDYYSYVTYETNVTDISKFYSDLEVFKLSFDNDQTFECGLRKYDNYPLLLMCRIFKLGIFSLSKIEKAKNFTDVNIRYDFIIQPVNIKETFICYSAALYYGYIRYIFNEILDFSSNDNLTIEYLFDFHPEETKGLTFNKNASDLECVINGKIKTCIVPKSHFEGKSGYYFTMHQNHFKGKSISYEVPPIKVILSNSNISNNTNNTNNTLIIIIAIIGGIIILVIIIFLILFYRKKEKSPEVEINKVDNDIRLVGNR